MRVVLRKDVPGLGRSGDVKDVAEGFGRNYLLPRGLATEASAVELKRVAEGRASAKAKRDRAQADAAELAQRLGSTTLTFALKVGPQGKAFGSVTERDVADALAQRGMVVPREKIHLPEPLRSIGDHVVEVRLLPDVRVTVRVTVGPE